MRKAFIYLLKKVGNPYLPYSTKLQGPTACEENRYTEEGREMLQYEVKFTDKNLICEKTREVQHYTRPEATL